MDWVGLISGYVMSSTFWIIVMVVVVGLALFFFGYFNRRSKLKYNAIEVVRYGNGKCGFNLTKAGLFRKNFYLLGFFDTGKEFDYRVADGRRILEAKTSHLHDIFGKKGFILMRSPKDNRILVPIDKIRFENLEGIMDIASGKFRDSSAQLFEEAVAETRGWLEKFLPYIMIGMIVVLTIVSIVINMQMTNHTTEKVGDMLISGCQNTLNTKPSTTP